MCGGVCRIHSLHSSRFFVLHIGRNNTVYTGFALPAPDRAGQLAGIGEELGIAISAFFGYTKIRDITRRCSPQVVTCQSCNTLGDVLCFGIAIFAFFGYTILGSSQRPI